MGLPDSKKSQQRTLEETKKSLEVLAKNTGITIGKPSSEGKYKTSLIVGGSEHSPEDAEINLFGNAINAGVKYLDPLAATELRRVAGSEIYALKATGYKPKDSAQTSGNAF